jgi:hypothetical protein
MVLRAGEFDRAARGARLQGDSLFPTHYVIEVNIRQVTVVPKGPGTANKDNTREIQDLTRVVTKGENLGQAIEKAQAILDLEKPATVVVEDTKVSLEDIINEKGN